MKMKDFRQSNLFMFLVFAGVVLSIWAFAYAPKLSIGGGGFFYDSTATITTLNKGLNVNGDLMQNGSPVSGAGVSYDTVLTAKKDTSRFGSLSRSNTWANTNTFNGLTYTGTTETGNLTVTGTFAPGNQNVSFEGYTQRGLNGNYLQEYFYKTKMGATTNTTTNIAHGIANYNTIREAIVMVKHDTSSATWRGLYTPSSMYAPNFMYWYIDTTNIKLTMGASCSFTDDSVFVTLKVHY